MEPEVANIEPEVASIEPEEKESTDNDEISKRDERIAQKEANKAARIAQREARVTQADRRLFTRRARFSVEKAEKEVEELEEKVKTDVNMAYAMAFCQIRSRMRGRECKSQVKKFSTKELSRYTSKSTYAKTVHTFMSKKQRKSIENHEKIPEEARKNLHDMKKAFKDFRNKYKDFKKTDFKDMDNFINELNNPNNYIRFTPGKGTFGAITAPSAEKNTRLMFNFEMGHIDDKGSLVGQVNGKGYEIAGGKDF